MRLIVLVALIAAMPAYGQTHVYVCNVAPTSTAGAWQYITAINGVRGVVVCEQLD